MTSVTITSASPRVQITSLDRTVHEIGRVVDDGPAQALRQLRLDVGKRCPHAGDDVEQVGAGRDLDADIDGLLAVEGDLRFIIVRAQRDIGHVLRAARWRHWPA